MSSIVPRGAGKKDSQKKQLTAFLAPKEEISMFQLIKRDAEHLWKKFYRHLVLHDVRWERYWSFGHRIAQLWEVSKKKILNIWLNIQMP